MEYTLRSGKVVTDEQIEAMAEAIEAGSLPGNGRARWWSAGRGWPMSPWT